MLVFCWITVKSVDLAGCISGRRRIVVKNAAFDQFLVFTGGVFKSENYRNSLQICTIPERRRCFDRKREKSSRFRDGDELHH